MWHCGMQLSMWGLQGLAEGQTQTNPARQAEHAPSNIFSLVPAVCVMLNPGTKGTHYSVHGKIMIIQPLKCCESLFVSFPRVALFMFIPKKKVCLLIRSKFCIHKWASLRRATSLASLLFPLTNSWWHWETRRHLAFPHRAPTFSPFIQSSCRLDGIAQLARIIIHNSGVSLWQSINRNRYPYFLYPPCIHQLSLNHYLLITESPSRDNRRGIHFQPLFHSPVRPLRFQCPLSPLSPLSLITPSGYQPFCWSL